VREQLVRGVHHPLAGVGLVGKAGSQVFRHET
jgi:hypothetical protein